jgi:hypothetical protein
MSIISDGGKIELPVLLDGHDQETEFYQSITAVKSF